MAGSRTKPGLAGGKGAAPRALKARLTDGKQRSAASKRWLERQLNDPYVTAAHRYGYRSRAAYKLIELDDRFHFLKRGGRVVDLGAAPGGWTQVAVARVGENGKVLGVDRTAMDPIPGAEVLILDLLDPDAPERIRAALNGPADVVLSDMAASSTGHHQTDHLRNVALCEAALEMAEDVLALGGGFVAKVLRGGAERTLLDRVKRGFASVRHVKPPASRPDSSEIYLVATGFRAGAQSE